MYHVVGYTFFDDTDILQILRSGFDMIEDGEIEIHKTMDLWGGDLKYMGVTFSLDNIC